MRALPRAERSPNRALPLLASVLSLLASTAVLGASEVTSGIHVEHNVEIRMRDGVTLRADLYRPRGDGPFAVLVYRTPYGKGPTADWYDTHLAAVERGYAVVLQDVRGRYASEGEFYPYVHEGRDGYDTIEWAARQPWSNGLVGTFGLSYPGAVQWLAALERPPHLKAMVPAMTFSTPRRFFYFNGVFDLSWLPWIHNSIAPDSRRRLDLPGAKTGDEARAVWNREGERMRRFLPLLELPDLEEVAPYYYDWLRRPPTDSWWGWAEIRGRYDRVEAAVLNLSGWYDEAYGPEGATTNFNGLVAARVGDQAARTHLVMGPWIHGVDSVRQTRIGDLEFPPAAAIDYNEVVLRWMDHHLRGLDNGVDREAPVRYFLMGANRWQNASSWPPEGVEPVELFLAGGVGTGSRGALQFSSAATGSPSTSFVSDPADPVSDPYPDFGPHDYGALADRTDLAIFESEPLSRDLEVIGAMQARIFVSCDCRDFDLWAKVLDVGPDGTAYNLMSPGLDVLRASYREPEAGRQLLQPETIYALELRHLITGNLFRRGHRIRLQISGAFFPHFSRNLQTGELESRSSEMRPARITVHHDPKHPSGLTLPVRRSSLATR